MDRQELEKLTKTYQVIQEQLQALSLQKEQFTAQRDEQKEAVAEIEKSTGKVYVSIGGAIVETTKEAALKDLKDKQDSVEMRLSLANKQYEEISKKEKSLRDEITKALKEQGA